MGQGGAVVNEECRSAPKEASLCFATAFTFTFTRLHVSSSHYRMIPIFEVAAHRLDINIVEPKLGLDVQLQNEAFEISPF